MSFLSHAPTTLRGATHRLMIAANDLENAANDAASHAAPPIRAAATTVRHEAAAIKKAANTLGNTITGLSSNAVNAIANVGPVADAVHGIEIAVNALKGAPQRHAIPEVDTSIRTIEGTLMDVRGVMDAMRTGSEGRSRLWEGKKAHDTNLHP
jgi:hypothetical protein